MFIYLYYFGWRLMSECVPRNFRLNELKGACRDTVGGMVVWRGTGVSVESCCTLCVPLVSSAYLYV